MPAPLATPIKLYAAEGLDRYLRNRVTEGDLASYVIVTTGPGRGATVG